MWVWKSRPMQSFTPNWCPLDLVGICDSYQWHFQDLQDGSDANSLGWGRGWERQPIIWPMGATPLVRTRKQKCYSPRIRLGLSLYVNWRGSTMHVHTFPFATSNSTDRNLLTKSSTRCTRAGARSNQLPYDYNNTHVSQVFNIIY